MENKLNYPIKYAILELKINKGWESNYEDVTFGFITSKCYVVNQNIKYHQDGTSTLTYDVVFPYKDIHTFKYSTLLLGYDFNETASIPNYSSYRICLNSVTVSEVFDTYEETLIHVEKANQNFKRETFMCLRISDYDKIVKEFEENQKICKKYEQLIIEKTTEMNVTKENLNIKKLTRKPTNN